VIREDPIQTATRERTPKSNLVRPSRWAGIEFAATIAHDMRAPLATIATSAEMLEQELEPTESTHLIAVIQRQAQRLQFMVQDLAEYSNIQAGKLSLHPSVLDLTDAVRDVCSEFQRFQSTHDLVVQLPAAPVYVSADEDKVRRILENLLSNAFKYSPRGTSVLARLSVVANGAKRNAVIEVEDEGSGVPPADRDRVFEPFVRLESRGGLGQGLGLHIVRSLVEAHKGRVWVEDGAATGARFCVALPVLASS
jgi:signal transduction histidine kinase